MKTPKSKYMTANNAHDSCSCFKDPNYSSPIQTIRNNPHSHIATSMHHNQEMNSLATRFNHEQSIQYSAYELSSYLRLLSLLSFFLANFCWSGVSGHRSLTMPIYTKKNPWGKMSPVHQVQNIIHLRSPIVFDTGSTGG